MTRRSNAFVPVTELLRRRMTTEQYAKTHPGSRKSVHTRSPKESLEYELTRRKGELVGRMNPGRSSFHEIGHYVSGSYSPLKRLGVGRISDPDAWLLAKEVASEVGHPVVLVGRGAPVTVAPAGGRLNPMVGSNPSDDKFSQGIRTSWDAASASDAQRASNPAGPAGLATVAISSNNDKTGVCVATYASQASCPDGKNSSYRCPLYGGGCYAEEGPTGTWILPKLNQRGGVTLSKSGTKQTTRIAPEIANPVDVARDEAAALESQLPEWKKLSQPRPTRVHVVGDAVTPECARIIGRAAVQYDYEVSDKRSKPVWTYTHAWRDVDRGDWPRRISVLASCDTLADAKKAIGRGWGTAAVVTRFQQSKMKKFGASYESEGVVVVPCPFEVNRVVGESEEEFAVEALKALGVKAKKLKKGQAFDMLPPDVQKQVEARLESEYTGKGKRQSRKSIQCITCRLCWKDDWLRDNKVVIVFAAHTKDAEKTVEKLIRIGGL